MHKNNGKYVTGGGLGPIRFRGNMFYKGHRDIALKASYRSKKASQSLKKLQFLGKSIQK
jgi:hypothetical protein